ncbi:CDP-diacylglycerol--glycerol-3-phosphate 3-phosphatidyltransferase [bacterium]|nr:CDP-diacylglycerol--glycerol-3-phosphate 3-phosphatidyltransferase [bacterium]
MLLIKKYFQKKNIPNALTIFRIILMIIVIIFVLVPFGPICYSLKLNGAVSSATASFQLNEILAAILFVIASLTDFLDGYIARKYHWVSDFGKIWDPLADKLLVDGVLICFAYLSLIPIWVCVLLILRDFIVDAFRMHALSKQIIVPASM